MTQIIINADDFGIRESTSERIVRAIENKQISSTTVLANGQAMDVVKACIQNHPEVSYGVHLNMTTGASVSNESILAEIGIIDGSGYFTGKIRTLHRLSGKVKGAIKSELKAQIDVVKSVCPDITHFDGHHHIHSHPEIKPIVSELMKEFGIERVRKDAMVSMGMIAKDFAKSPSYAYHELARRNYYQSRYRTTDAFYGISEYYMQLEKVSTVRTDGVIELMCHLGDHHQREREIVEKELLREVLSYQLVSYKGI